MNDKPCESELPSPVLALLDTFRRSPDAVSERAQATLLAFGLVDLDRRAAESRPAAQ
ncbi:hypothetical protein A33M_3631 [Rhodovulum sp. PH10]|uniref:hypothetical protein n=1 Tax=Rhodovulum sp. PH10 TaxID=1187851 RepID=UPI00027C2DB0|nr:hypothetical protein [Rhodovulum sp. PH10]EJW11020.1 hypothetical protein A33M_3631 [Rhodovulum sp. PH10]